MSKREKRKPKKNKKLKPLSKKKPRTDSTFEHPIDEKPAWRIGTLDLVGQWGWQEIEKEFFFNKILPKIKNFETMLWNDILGRNNHAVLVSQISREAQVRLEDLKLDDNESLISLRLTGTQRIWGIRIGNILQLLWWDPNHEVCPSEKKHT